jgi:hypothetical protein
MVEDLEDLENYIHRIIAKIPELKKNAPPEPYGGSVGIMVSLSLSLPSPYFHPSL